MITKGDLEIWSMAYKTLHDCTHCPFCFIGKQKRNCSIGMCEAIRDKDSTAIEFYLTMHKEICQVGGEPGKAVIKEWEGNMKDNESTIIKDMLCDYHLQK